MSTNYLLSDMLIRIKNGQKAGITKIKVVNSKLCRKVLHKFFKAGFLKNDYTISSNHIIIELNYFNNQINFNNISVVSTPGRRVYISVKYLWELEKDFGVYILSTPKGIKTNKEALLLNVGGELLCKIS